MKKNKRMDIKKGLNACPSTGKEIRIQGREGNNIVIALVDRR